jgi:diadenosine tetraphosphate (Ap4A) HIT family hydrolase
VARGRHCDTSRMDECLACDLTAGRRPLPGGLIHGTPHWLIEHCVGPLGVGTLIVKPRRHVTAVAELSDAEAKELGPLLRRTSAVVSRLVEAEQVYNCLWSHAGGVRGHLHYVVQPVTKQQMSAFDAHGPGLTLAMFRSGRLPDAEDVERVAEQARRLFAIN